MTSTWHETPGCSSLHLKSNSAMLCLRNKRKTSKKQTKKLDFIFRKTGFDYNGFLMKEKSGKTGLS
jgi:hypothetical protein